MSDISELVDALNKLIDQKLVLIDGDRELPLIEDDRQVSLPHKTQESQEYKKVEE